MTVATTDRATALRLAFDRSFAEPAGLEKQQFEDFLAIRIGAEPWAIRLAEVAGLFADRRITPVPSSAATLIGTAGFRGTILPIYDLARLLGRTAAAPLRWLVTAAGAPTGFAFEGFDRHVRVSPDAVLPQHAGKGAAVQDGECLLLNDQILPIIRMRSVLDTIAKPGIMHASQKEP